MTDLSKLVRPLVWERHPMGWVAGAMLGPAYIIDIRMKDRMMFVKGINPSPQFDTLDAAKAAAQADYTARILAAIDTDEVKALVEAANEHIAFMEGTGLTFDFLGKLRAALRQIGGEA